MTTARTDRILSWEGCFNVRDLGGLRTRDGHAVRWGALVRSDLLCRLTPAGAAALVDHGVRSIVDLRFKDEVARDWDRYPFRPAEGSPVRYVNAPLDAGRDPDAHANVLAAYLAAKSRAELNRLDLDWHATGIGAAVREIADAPPGGVLVHCHGGKDRTGIVVALVLSVLGVDDGDIADDYAMTTLALEPLISEWLDEQAFDDAERERLTGLATPARDAMLDTLAYLRDRYGSAEEYLAAAGVTDEHVERLRARLLEPA